MVPPVHWARNGPWGHLQGPRGAEWPVLPHPSHGLRSQCLGLGFKLRQQLGHVSEGSCGWMGVRGGSLASSTPPWVQGDPYWDPTATLLRSTHPHYTLGL